MKRQRKHSKLYYQYLMSYLILLLLPLLTLSMFMYGYVLKLLKEDAYANSIEALNKAKGTVEAQLQFITSSEHRLYLHNVLSNFSLEDQTTKAIEAQEELTKYLKLNPYLIDIAYYQENDEYIVTALSSCKKELFWEEMYRFENWSYEQFLKDIQEHNTYFFLEEQQVKGRGSSIDTKKRVVCLVVPLLAREEKCVIFLIDGEFFTNVISVDEDEEGIAALILENGQVLIANGNEALKSVVCEQPVNLHDDLSEVDISGKKYLRSSVYSETYKWSYETWIPLNIIEEKVAYVKWLMFLMCFFVCAGGALGIYYFLKQNYAPIKRLELASDVVLKNEGNNEIDHIRLVLDYLKTQNQKLKAEGEKKDFAQRERFVSQWITGWFNEETVLTAHAQTVGILLDKQLYQMGIMRLQIVEQGRELDVKNALLTAKQEGIDIFIKVQPETKSVFLIVGCNENQREDMNTCFINIPRILYQSTGLESILALGRVVDDKFKVRESYLEAVKALEYRLILHGQRIIRYEEILEYGACHIDVQPRLLGIFIRNKDADGLESLLKESLNEISNSKPGIRRVRMLCNDFIYELERTIEGVNRDLFVEQPLCYDILDMLQYDTFEELMKIIGLIGNDIIEHINELKSVSIMDDILNYVQKNFCSADFSTTMVAEEFQISITSLSKYFKANFKKNLSDYIAELKVDRAKELLVYTDMPIKEVAEQVGYYNATSFIRRFKQVTGMTPGELRSSVKKIE